jgi:hypothetical protein
MPRIEILTEEPSIKEVLNVILPKILSDKWKLDENYFIRPHEGKSDLKKSIPKKVTAFSSSPYEKIGIVIIQDQDSHDCKILKTEILELCEQNNKNQSCEILVRIVCRELESWYLGDMEAIEKAYPKFKAKNYATKSKFRTPDNLNNSQEEIEKILPEFTKIDSAKRIAPHLNTDILSTNKSISFNIFLKGITDFFEKFENDE